jgi:hypothetical protein
MANRGGRLNLELARSRDAPQSILKRMAAHTPHAIPAALLTVGALLSDRILPGRLLAPACPETPA